MIGYFICGAVACAALLCAAFSERLKLREYVIPTDRIDGELRIVQLSDLHDCRFGKRQEKLIEMVKAARPDLIVLTGDMVNDDSERTKKLPILTREHPMRELLDGILPLAPVYMVYGNHEANIPELGELTNELRGLGVKLIGGETQRLTIKGRTISLSGIDDPRFFGAGKQKMSLRERLSDDMERSSPGLEKWRLALAELSPEPEVFSVLISHRPEEYRLYGDFDLSFSGHAHGGQWRLPPLINGVYAPHQGIFPKHAGGLYELEGGGYHIVSRGLSRIRCPRIFNRPEVCVAVVKGKG